MNRVAIVLLNYNTYKFTIECLKSIFVQDYKCYSIFIVDNASTNDSILHLCKFLDDEKRKYSIIDSKDQLYSDSQIILINSRENNGYAAGNNIALRKAIKSNKYDYYWVINNDTVVEKDTLSLMVKCLEKDSLKRPVGNYVYYYDNKDVMQMAGGLEISRKNFKPFFSYDENKIDYLGGVSYLIDNNFISKYGLMYEGYFLNSEDLEYFYQYKLKFLNINKEKLPFNVVGKLYHKESATQGKVSPMSNYYYSRNLLYSCKKLQPKRMTGLYAFFIARIIKWSFIEIKMSKSIIKAILDYKKGIIGKVNYFG